MARYTATEPLSSSPTGIAVRLFHSLGGDGHLLQIRPLRSFAGGGFPQVMAAISSFVDLFEGGLLGSRSAALRCLEMRKINEGCCCSIAEPASRHADSAFIRKT